MYSKEPVWLTPEDIIEKHYKDFCFYNQITDRRITKLFDAFLLRGRYFRHTSKVEILQESFEDLQNHIRYTLFKQVSKQEAKMKRPKYLDYKYEIPYDHNRVWFTPSDLLETYSQFLKYEKDFTTDFLGDLTLINLVAGKYQPSEHCYHISLTSFVEILKFREYNISQYRILPPPGMI